MAWIEHIGLIFLIRAKLQQIQYCATKSISFLTQKPKKNAQTPQKRAKDSKLKVFFIANYSQRYLIKSCYQGTEGDTIRNRPINAPR
jgi:hypothetical protein